MKLNETKYARWYLSLIDKALLRNTNNDYTETHHIIPKSLGGTNKKDNLVKLTAKEHYIAHLLLMKCYDDKLAKQKMCAAFLYMSKARNQYTGHRYTSNLYEYHKRIKTKIRKERMSGANNPMFGKKHSEKTRKRISEKRLGINTNTPESLERKRQRFLTNNPNYDPEVKKKQMKSMEARLRPFEIMDLDGKIHTGTNLAKFCRDKNIHHGNLITYKNSKGWILISK